MKRLLTIAALVLASAGSLSAQSVAGLKVRADKSTNAADPDAAGDIKVTAVTGGVQVVAPTAGVFWNPANTVTGPYTLKGTFTQNKKPGHLNYYGIVFGGANLDAATQNYIYFLIAENGTFLVKHRAGDATTHDVMVKTASAAITKPDAAGKSSNVLEVRVAADKIDYVVNGTVVHTTPKAGMTARTDGLWGFRVNHTLDVTVTGLAMTK